MSDVKSRPDWDRVWERVDAETKKLIEDNLTKIHYKAMKRLRDADNSDYLLYATNRQKCDEIIDLLQDEQVAEALESANELRSNLRNWENGLKVRMGESDKMLSEGGFDKMLKELEQDE